MSVEPTIRIQQQDFDLAAEVERLTQGRRDIGAVVTFTGLCRDEDGRLVALERGPVDDLVQGAIARIARQAIERWPLTGLTAIHRHGRIAPGENIVLVIAVASHRQAAFEAAEYLMDYLKSRAPFWKKETTPDGGRWVDARENDEEALKRW